MSKSHRFWEILTPEQIQEIHQDALSVLEQVGMYLPNREILEYLHNAGGQVDFTKQRAFLPPELVEASIQKIPSRFTWYSRNPANSLDMNPAQTYFGGPGATINVIDLEKGRRPGNTADGENICRLCDALPNLSVTYTGIQPRELTGVVLDAWSSLVMYSNSSKAMLHGCSSQANAQIVLQMAEVVADSCGLGRHQLPLLVLINTTSPLGSTPYELAGMLEFIRKGVPLAITPAMQAGATGPVTLAGVLVQVTAEFLGLASIVQLIKPGLPVMYGCVSSIFDMRKMMFPYGAPEADLLTIAVAQIARYYGILSRSTGSGSDANVLDMQTGVESLMSILACLMAGVNFVFQAVGELENSLAVSYEKIIIDNEIISMAKRLARGIEVTPETRALDVIREVGPGNHFLSADHTLRHFRSEHYTPNLFNRDKYEVWEAAGARRIEERVRDRVHDLLKNHQPEPLPANAKRELEAIYASVRRSAGM